MKTSRSDSSTFPTRLIEPFTILALYFERRCFGRARFLDAPGSTNVLAAGGVRRWQVPDVAFPDVSSTNARCRRDRIRPTAISASKSAQTAIDTPASILERTTLNHSRCYPKHGRNCRRVALRPAAG